jgi:two-component system sensor histidine kinase CpxA
MVAGSPEQYWVGVRMLLPQQSGATTPSIGTLLLQSPTFWSNPFFFEIGPWLTIVAVAALVSILCWAPIVRGLTHSITQMMKATAAIAEGHFDVRVETKRRDELGKLGHSINQMAERLRVYLHGQKRFLGDVAHELRSPLGRMQIAIGILEEKAELREQSYLADLKEDVEEMSALTTDLLAFARAEMRPEAVEMVRLNLRQIVEQAAEAENDGHTNIAIDVDPGLHVRGNEKYLTRAFANLVRNAVRYAGADGPIQISAQPTADRIEVRVADSGPGVPEEALEKIFVPFYRLESARDRKSGGTGLGLAIARSSIEACEGSISCRNRQPRGFEAVVLLNPA